MQINVVLLFGGVFCFLNVFVCVDCIGGGGGGGKNKKAEAAAHAVNIPLRRGV